MRMDLDISHQVEIRLPKRKKQQVQVRQPQALQIPNQTEQGQTILPEQT